MQICRTLENTCSLWPKSFCHCNHAGLYKISHLALVNLKKKLKISFSVTLPRTSVSHRQQRAEKGFCFVLKCLFSLWLCVPAWIYLNHMHAGSLGDQKKVLDSPVAGVTGGCKLSNVGGCNKSSERSARPSHLPSPQGECLLPDSATPRPH